MFYFLQCPKRDAASRSVALPHLVQPYTAKPHLCRSHFWRTTHAQVNPGNPHVAFSMQAALMSGRRDSNPRPSAWEANALPTEPLPHLLYPSAVRHSATRFFFSQCKSNDFYESHQHFPSEKRLIVTFFSPPMLFSAFCVLKSSHLFLIFVA